MDIFLLVLYSLALLFIFLFSMGQLNLTWHYLHASKPTKEKSMDKWPVVTVQLPVYNEKYVAERLIDAICALDYPHELLEIQVLDDSIDITSCLIEKKVSLWKDKGINILHIKRTDRKGFKAGALAEGLEKSAGEFIAIFDADFLPEQDFLKRTLPIFESNTGAVQTRWGHINRDYSLLTRLQAFGLDAHFTVEQTGRSHAGSFINFNGTAGIWRKKCIVDAGGWSADTLTEDLDLSYRAQLKGWKFQYLEDYVAPAELPVIMSAIKSQQYRWNKGAAETARKNLGKVLRSPLSTLGKIHAFFHLLNSSVFVSLLLAAILSVPVLFIKASRPSLRPVFYLGGAFLLGFFSIGYYYWVAYRKTHGSNTWGFFKTFPIFLIVSMGLSLHNGVAVLEGLFGIKTPFVRTPKFNLKSRKDVLVKNDYVFPSFSWTTLVEGLLTLYFTAGVFMGIYLHETGLILFHVMLSCGFAAVFYYTVKPFRRVVL